MLSVCPSGAIESMRKHGGAACGICSNKGYDATYDVQAWSTQMRATTRHSRNGKYAERGFANTLPVYQQDRVCSHFLTADYAAFSSHDADAAVARGRSASLIPATASYRMSYNQNKV